MLRRPYTEIQTAINYTAAAPTREISKKLRIFPKNPGLLEFGRPRRTRKCFHVIYRTVIASRDVAKTIYGVSDCYQLHSGNMDTSNFKKLRLFKRILRDLAKTKNGVSDCYQLHSGSTDTRNFKKKLRLFRKNPGLLEFARPQRTRKPFHALYKTCSC